MKSAVVDEIAIVAIAIAAVDDIILVDFVVDVVFDVVAVDDVVLTLLLMLKLLMRITAVR